MPKHPTAPRGGEVQNLADAFLAELERREAEQPCRTNTVRALSEAVGSYVRRNAEKAVAAHAGAGVYSQRGNSLDVLVGEILAKPAPRRIELRAAVPDTVVIDERGLDLHRRLAGRR